jgi:cytochrome b pre-mRNA-processing protein 3
MQSLPRSPLEVNLILSRFFGRNRLASEAVVLATYETIVAAARQKFIFADWHVPDTALGRYESIALHMILFLRRTKDAPDALRGLGQEVVEEFFKDVDHSLRELGIGDAGVPKRMKKLARMFYGRAESYDGAIAGNDQKALAAALARNIMPGVDGWAGAENFAAYAIALWAIIAAQDDDAIAGGHLIMSV